MLLNGDVFYCIEMGGCCCCYYCCHCCCCCFCSNPSIRKPDTAIGHNNCGRRPQYLKSHPSTGLPPPDSAAAASKLLIALGCQIGHFCEQINVTNRSFTVSSHHSLLWTKATTFFKVTERLFAVFGCHSLLWLQATTFEKSRHRAFNRC